MKSRIFYRTFIVLIILFFYSSISLEAQIRSTDQYLELGDLKIYKLQDAQFKFSVSTLSGIEKAEAIKLAGGKDSVWTPVNSYLIKTGTKNILVDAGIGGNSAQLTKQLEEAGVSPDKIDLVYLTHFHQDHIGGLLTSDGKRIFPNAIIRASKKENDFWLTELTDQPIIVKQKQNQNKMKTCLAPYMLENVYKPFYPDEDLGNGMKAILAVGHTPGHTIYSIASKGKELWFIGDLLHIGVVQFKKPTAYVGFDSDSPVAIKTRIEFFKQSALKKIIVAGAHLPNFYTLEMKGDGFIATPVHLHD